MQGIHIYREAFNANADPNSSALSNQWSGDLLGNYVLAPGQTIHLFAFHYGSHPTIKTPYQMIVVTYADGTRMSWSINICEYNLTLTY